MWLLVIVVAFPLTDLACDSLCLRVMAVVAFPLIVLTDLACDSGCDCDGSGLQHGRLIAASSHH